jgi:2-oxoglutarate dehydrogenase E2 component (dihydrolipoamide succinyltransferase)
MKIEIKIPSVGESVQEALLAQWFRRDGDLVRKDEILFVIETDKVTLEIAAEADGILQILVPAGETLPIGTVVGMLDTAAQPIAAVRKEAPPVIVPEPAPAVQPQPEMFAAQPEALSPSVRRLVAEKQLDVSKIEGTGRGGRVTKEDVILHLAEAEPGPKPEPELEGAWALAELGAEEVAQRVAPEREVPPVRPVERPPVAPGEPVPAGRRAVPEEATTRKPMTPIRQRIAQRLLEARQHTAMLTTFNEIDMSRVQAIRAQFKESYRARYGVPLGIMSFFIKASIVALEEFPEVNAFIAGKDVVYHHYYHIGVAIGAERGLVVPVIRHADQLGFAELELAIAEFVRKVRENRLEIADLEGGTFTISNGGVYGSLLSTPILNTPQSGILGMHKIEERPVAIAGQVVIRPMMYVALSYDHRIIDGREAVSFLKRIKECIENPERIMLEI